VPGLISSQHMRKHGHEHCRVGAVICKIQCGPVRASLHVIMKRCGDVWQHDLQLGGRQ
jgi:hypothetical protein